MFLEQILKLSMHKISGVSLSDNRFMVSPALTSFWEHPNWKFKERKKKKRMPLLKDLDICSEAKALWVLAPTCCVFKVCSKTKPEVKTHTGTVYVSSLKWQVWDTLESIKWSQSYGLELCKISSDFTGPLKEWNTVEMTSSPSVADCLLVCLCGGSLNVAPEASKNTQRGKKISYSSVMNIIKLWEMDKSLVMMSLG